MDSWSSSNHEQQRMISLTWPSPIICQNLFFEGKKPHGESHMVLFLHIHRAHRTILQQSPLQLGNAKRPYEICNKNTSRCTSFQKLIESCSSCSRCHKFYVFSLHFLAEIMLLHEIQWLTFPSFFQASAPRPKKSRSRSFYGVRGVELRGDSDLRIFCDEILSDPLSTYLFLTLFQWDYRSCKKSTKNITLEKTFPSSISLK